ncbi:MAG TPA: hypothetical protein DIW64_16185 [Cellvibrio sp.]|nr:hypothetical protein [Cellvibrio sp.]
MKEQNPILGHWTCPQGGKAEVYQTKKAGRHFYTRCACCGLMQGTGAALQQSIFDNAEFIAGISVVAPSNVVMDRSRVVEGEIAKPALDFDPSEPVQGEEVEAAPEKSKFNYLVPLGAFLAAGAAALWMH